MTRVKICGLTRRDDALAAAEWGADALGFVFAERSKRRADPDAVARIVEEVPPFVTLVGVFQDQPLSEVRRIMAVTGLHVAQLHGRESPEFLDGLGCPVLKAVSIGSEADLEILKHYPRRTSFLLDSGPGGSGRTFDWAWARMAMRHWRIVLAGGLTPENVAEAVRAVHPWAVDTASGVESAPGVKDARRMHEFIRNVREVDRTLERSGEPHA